MKYLALCSTTSAAIKFRRKLHKLNIPVETIPVPRSLSTSCGIAVIFSWADDIDVTPDDGIIKIYAINQDQYSLVYETE